MIVTVTPNPCVDKTLFIDRLDPGRKIRSDRYACIAGGKGCNVSRAVKVMGGETLAMPMVGGATGRHVVDMLENNDKTPCKPVWVANMTRTITTVLEEPLHRQTALFEPGPLITEAERQRFIELFREVLDGAALVTLNGSAPDPKLDGLYRDLVGIAHDAGVRTIVDAYGPILEQALDARPFMVKPNVEEAAQLTGHAITGRTEQWAAVDWFRDRGIALVVLSLGADGALVASETDRFQVRPPAIEEINPVGSGDALVAGFALGITRQWPLRDTARLGVAMGTANAMSWDIGSFTPQEVEALYPKVEVQTA